MFDWFDLHFSSLLIGTWLFSIELDSRAFKETSAQWLDYNIHNNKKMGNG